MTTETSFSLESELLGLWNKFLNRSDLTIDDDFFESGGDSLLAAGLLVEAERLTQGTIPPSILFETGTVRRLAERLGQQKSLTPQPTVTIGGKTGRLFHFFHGDFETGGLSIRRVAEMLDPDRPMLAIAPHGIDGERVPASIEEMAADRLPLILRAQPRGPYILGGHCNGALVAFEAARLLANSGHRVDLVVMLDPVAVSLRPWVRLLLMSLDLTERALGVAPDARRQARDLAWLELAKSDRDSRIGDLTKSWTKRWGGVGWRLARGLFTMRSPDFNKTMPGELGSAKPLVPEKFDLFGAYTHAMSVYRPSRLAVPILYVALSYSGDGWRRMSHEIELIDVPGHHWDLSDDSVAPIMDRIRARLDDLDGVS